MKKSRERRKLTLHTETIIHLSQLSAIQFARVQGGRPDQSDTDSCSAAECTVTD